MGIEDIRKRLEALNRNTLGERIIPASTLPNKSMGRRSNVTAFGLSSMVPGAETRVGKNHCYVVDRLVRKVWESGDEICDRFISTMERKELVTRARAFHESLGACAAASPKSLLFADLETCGFSGTAVFLIGVMFATNEDLQVVQLLARNLSEEQAIITLFEEYLDSHPYLVTFNGKSFDWPFLADRAMTHRVRLSQPAGHCDLLHVARRKYKKLLPNCKLQTLEQYVCGRRRYDDVPGSLIPSTYHHFVRTGDATHLRDVIHHNFLDLITLADILAVLIRTV